MSKLTCRVQGCFRKHHGRGYCRIHHARARCEREPGVEVNYVDVHIRLQKERGLARLQPCADCGKQRAKDWSYDNQDPDELRTSVGTRYSLNLDHYQARCLPCHRSLDARHRRIEQSEEPSALKIRATELEPEIRNAIAERKAARDSKTKEFWDSELDRLTALLLTG